MIAGLGTDIVEIKRMEASILKREDLLIKRLFTEKEQAYCRQKTNPYPHWAARFAIKEAFFKALGTGLRQGMSWQDVEVINNELGAPSLLFSKTMQRTLKEKGIGSHHVSISHSDESAIGVVILEHE